MPIGRPTAPPPRPGSWGLTRYAVLKEASRRDCDVGPHQFDEYLNWGLIESPVDGRWFETIVGRLIDVHAAAKQARRLERRTVLLGAQDPEKRRHAMLKLIPLVRAPKLKMRRLERALSLEAQQPRPRDVFGRPSYWYDPTPPGWHAPLPDQWSAVLTNRLTRDRFGDISHSQYFVADRLLMQPQAITEELKGMPREEVILLLTIRELSRAQHAMKTPLKDLKG